MTDYVHPGYVKSITDGDVHWVGGLQLIRLYGLDRRTTVIVVGRFGMQGRPPRDDDRHFYPKSSGRYPHLEAQMDRKIARDAGSGEFVSPEYAEQHPDTTVTETVKAPQGATPEQLDLALKAYASAIIDGIGDHEGALLAALNAALGA